ncbi:adenylosuccinate lyase [Candidatus Aminicenantes bacterium AC-334-K16]|nr:adenylosuccinate lyase [Candidatus Aminicenantes bacterium AC-334-K16]
MIRRYTRPRMGSIWTDENRYRKWLEVEIAVCEAWHELGRIPGEALAEIKEKANFSVERIEEIEKTVKHDLIAFLTSVAEYIGPLSRYVHLGLTSYDVVDTAFSLLIKESLEEILVQFEALKGVLREQALKHKKTVMIGRTHGVHAEPITFGFKLLVWYEETKRNILRIKQARETISYGRIAGAVGTFGHLDPRVEEIALRKLGLKPAPVSTQILQRDRHAEVLATLAIAASSLDKFATEIRHLQKTEVLEVEEPFTRGQKGSSAMPHKRNPVRTERISGLARLARSNLQAALENIPLWHERDISHSSVERVIFPDTFILVDFLLAETINIIQNWHVYPEKMKKNLELTRGLIFSQRVLLVLTDKGLSREKAYQLVQRNSLKAWEEHHDLLPLLLADDEVTAVLSPEEIKNCFTLEPFLSQIDYIYERVLSDES